MNVDFEGRVEFDRLRRYRLQRAREALEKSECGALLLFDVNNIRYVTATKIGEWERDKLCRFALLMRGKEPIVWDFGSARGRPPSPLLRLACPTKRQGRYARDARYRTPGGRTDATPRQGNRVSASRGRRR